MTFLLWIGDGFTIGLASRDLLPEFWHSAPPPNSGSSNIVKHHQASLPHERGVHFEILLYTLMRVIPVNILRRSSVSGLCESRDSNGYTLSLRCTPPRK
jgi:hypothetical protein